MVKVEMRSQNVIDKRRPLAGTLVLSESGRDAGWLMMERVHVRVLVNG
jgi:hypothetical protein